MKGKTNDVRAEVTEVYGEYAPWLLTMKYWTAEFKRCRISIFDSRPNEVITIW